MRMSMVEGALGRSLLAKEMLVCLACCCALMCYVAALSHNIDVECFLFSHL